MTLAVASLFSLFATQAPSEIYYSDTRCSDQVIFTQGDSKLLLLDPNPIKSSAELFQMTQTSFECTVRRGADYKVCEEILKSEGARWPQFEIKISETMPFASDGNPLGFFDESQKSVVLTIFREKNQDVCTLSQ